MVRTLIRKLRIERYEPH